MLVHGRRASNNKLSVEKERFIMSWSVSCLGKPAKVIEYLESEETKSRCGTRDEYEAALPHIVGIVALNQFPEQNDYVEPVLKVEASGSAYTVNGERKTSSCRVSVDQVGYALV